MQQINRDFNWNQEITNSSSSTLILLVKSMSTLDREFSDFQYSMALCFGNILYFPTLQLMNWYNVSKIRTRVQPNQSCSPVGSFKY